MLYTNPNTSNLPTLRETVEILRDLSSRFPVVHRGPFTPIVNDEDMYILTRTDSMYSIKPNITRQGALFGWMEDFDIRNPQNYKASIFTGDGNPNYLLNNIIKEDAEIIFESHPLFRLLQNGIELPKLRRPIRVYNPYGVAHAYGLKSQLISLTASIDIAAFHACHKYDPGENRFIPITDPNKSGLLFIFELSAPFSMIPNLSTIGKQAFERPGINKLFAFQTNPNTNFCALPFVKGFQFRHSSESTKFFSEFFGGGLSFHPKELIADKISTLLGQKNFSERAFRRNLQYNPKDVPEINLKKLRDQGYYMDKNFSLEFTQDEIQRLWFYNVSDIWEDFWDEIITPMLTEEQERVLLDLPNNPKFKDYFLPEYWQRLINQ